MEGHCYQQDGLPAIVPTGDMRCGAQSNGSSGTVPGKLALSTMVDTNIDIHIVNVPALAPSAAHQNHDIYKVSKETEI